MLGSSLSFDHTQISDGSDTVSLESVQLRIIKTLFLHSQDHITLRLHHIRVIEVSIESGGHAGHYYDVYPHVQKHARILAFIHAVFLHSQDHITIKFHQIRDVEVSTESGGHAGHDCCVSMYTSKNAHMLVGCPE